MGLYKVIQRDTYQTFRYYILDRRNLDYSNQTQDQETYLLLWVLYVQHVRNLYEIFYSHNTYTYQTMRFLELAYFGDAYNPFFLVQKDAGIQAY